MKFEENPATSGGTFLKLKSGQSIVGVFRGDPREFYSKFSPDGKSQECKKGESKAKFRFRLNFVTKNEKGDPEARIFEQGAVVYEQLKALNQDYPLESNFVKVTRQGEGLDTSYSILPIPKGELTPQQEETVKTVKLLDLAEVSSEGVAKTDEFGFPPDLSQSQEIPF